MIHLQKRDALILRLAYDQQFLTTKQVLRFCFPGVHHSEGYRRLKELERSGFIKRIPSITAGTGDYIRVTQKGEEIASGDVIFPVPQLRRLNLYLIQHDILVTEARMRLQAIWQNTEWVAEQHLRQKWKPDEPWKEPLIPDGVLISTSAGLAIAVELENTPKAKSRYLKLLDKWNCTNKVNWPLYITTSVHIMTTIRQCMRETNECRAKVMLYDDLMTQDSPPVYEAMGDARVLVRHDRNDPGYRLQEAQSEAHPQRLSERREM
jgi:hypothetical protein